MTAPIELPSNTLYILSGPPASGKSTFLKKLGVPQSAILSRDKLREQAFGSQHSYDKHGVNLIYNQNYRNQLTLMLKELLKIKLNEKQTVFVDTTALTDKDRKSFVSMAQHFHMPVKILIFPPEHNLEWNTKRTHRVPEKIIEEFTQRYEQESKYPYEIIDHSKEYTLTVRHTIPDDVELFVIGDIHAMYEQTTQLIQKQGFYIEDNTVKHKDKKKKLLFIGDVVDRGPDTIKALQLAYNSVTEEGHYMILGNHEEKLIQNFDEYKEKKSIRLFERRSYAVAQTFYEFLKLPFKEQEKLINFLKDIPHYYVKGDTAFTHGFQESFNPLLAMKSDCIYGMTKDDDADNIYSELHKAGINTYRLVRGHTPIMTESESVISLMENGEYGGNLVIYNAQTKERQRQKTQFNYHEKAKPIKELFRALLKADNEQLLQIKTSQNGFYRIYKYSKKAFYKEMWKTYPILKETRGLVLDAAGNIVQYPFTKLLKLEEDDTTTYQDDKEIIAVDKVNGFLAAITLDRYGKLLITTTGSFESRFTKYIKEFITKELEEKLKEYLQDKNKTLLFEVVHKDDPHIVKYSEENNDFGLYLIGEREKVLHSDMTTEKELDTLARILAVKRPSWKTTTIAALKEELKTTELEGFIIRDTNKEQTPLCKVKADIYNTIKRIARLPEKKLEKLFKDKHSDELKKIVCEEHQWIIDTIKDTQKENKEKFCKTLSDQERTIIVRDLLLDKN